ncbi:hypothetical protein ACOMHN_052190 [Nucella lapillus]
MKSHFDSCNFSYQGPHHPVLDYVPARGGGRDKRTSQIALKCGGKRLAGKMSRLSAAGIVGFFLRISGEMLVFVYGMGHHPALGEIGGVDGMHRGLCGAWRVQGSHGLETVRVQTAL